MCGRGWIRTRCFAASEERLAEALVMLSEPDALPAVFHCAAGKDRTGVACALLLYWLVAAAQAADEERRLAKTYLTNDTGTERVAVIREALQHAMEKGCGVYRVEAMRDNLTWILSNPIWVKK